MNISRVSAVYSAGNFHYEQIANPKRERHSDSRLPGSIEFLTRSICVAERSAGPFEGKTLREIDRLNRTIHSIVAGHK